MNEDRILTRDEKALKSVTGALIEAVGGAKAALRVLVENGHKPSLSLLYAYASHNDARHFMPVNYVAILERAVGRPIVTAHQAGELGSDLVPVGAGAEGDREGIDAASALDAILRLCRKSSSLKLMLATAVADGSVDAAEREQLREGAQALLAFVYRFLQKLERS